MSDELFDIVNGQDHVIGQEMRSVVHQRGLWHRGVHIFLFTGDGKLLVQRRSKDRLHAPSALDCSVSEHVKAGEGYYAAAMRGLEEEMGVEEVDLHSLIKFRMNYGPNDNEISTLYQGEVDPVKVKFDPIEVEWIGYYSLTELEEFLLKEEFMFSYWFEQIIRWYLIRPSALEVLEIYSDTLT
jgi:isopentenyl-diphosphate delta-isomerase